MTEQQRMDREALLKRAAAAAGAVYFAPVLTSAASAGVAAPCKGRCKAGDPGERKCQLKGGGDCHCIVKAGKKKGRCKLAQPRCGADDRCAPGTPCDVALFCNSSQTCICFVPVPGDGTSRDCVNFPSNFCSDYKPCNKADGSGCQAGECCLDTCCPEGLCSPPCNLGAASRISRTTGSGATLTL
jgi:hypothetical protein